jgi:hypothetical protein
MKCMRLLTRSDMLGFAVGRLISVVRARLCHQKRFTLRSRFSRAMLFGRATALWRLNLRRCKIAPTRITISLENPTSNSPAKSGRVFQ